MDMDLTPFFKKYEAITEVCNRVFARVKSSHPEQVVCRLECADCCHAIFDLTLIEALYINHHFNRTFTGPDKDQLLECANRSDRQTYKLKRAAVKDLENGKNEVEILARMALERVRCPLLADNNLCRMYDYRPITCRLYGIPTSIAGKAHTCGLSGFKEGQSYPTVKLEQIQKQLYDLSQELVTAIKSRHIKMAEILVPISMAILTDYDDAYLGIGEQAPEKDPPERKP